MENNKGITLITLVTSIILLIIIASITILTNIDAFNYMRFEGEKTEIEQMEKLVDEIASDYQTYLIEENTSKKYEDYFNSRYNTSDFNMKLLSSHKNEAAELINKNTGLSSESDSVFYFSQDDLIKYFNLKGINPVVVDFSTRKVYSVNGIKDPNDKNIIYYTSSDWGANTRVTHINNSEELEFTAEKVSSTDSFFDIKLEISKKLNNISEVYAVCSSDDSTKIKKVENFHIKYEDNKTTIQFTVNGKGKYVFKVVNDVNQEYESQELELTEDD